MPQVQKPLCLIQFFGDSLLLIFLCPYFPATASASASIRRRDYRRIERQTRLGIFGFFELIFIIIRFVFVLVADTFKKLEPSESIKLQICNLLFETYLTSVWRSATAAHLANDDVNKRFRDIKKGTSRLTCKS